ncbi:MAG: ATP-binding protein [Hydrogenophaga sp.]|nr:ATP-binding protein [Hydrogenophaga sp.]
MAFVVTLLGGESTGKSRLSQALLERLEASRLTTVLVREHLRDWCTEQGRAPFSHEQLALAREQARQIDTAATLSGVDVVIADTTGLMIAAYSELYFEDRSLWPETLAWQRQHADLTLLMGLDLPWVSDGFFRDSPQIRDATDAVLRRELQAAGMAFQTVFGQGPSRVDNALRAIGAAMGRDLSTFDPSWSLGRRPWTCDSCSDPDCEHRLFSALLSQQNPDTAP